jgi:membrane protein implicated in regulation of membrane protease activity
LLFVGAVLLALFVVPKPWGLVLVAAAAVVEVGESFFWLHLSRRRRIQMGAETLIGATAQVVSDCRPLGQVRLRGERWRARCEAGASAGDTVRVVDREGLTLLVEPE